MAIINIILFGVAMYSVSQKSVPYIIFNKKTMYTKYANLLGGKINATSMGHTKRLGDISTLTSTCNGCATFSNIVNAG